MRLALHQVLPDAAAEPGLVPHGSGNLLVDFDAVPQVLPIRPLNRASEVASKGGRADESKPSKFPDPREGA